MYYLQVFKVLYEKTVYEYTIFASENL